MKIYNKTRFIYIYMKKEEKKFVGSNVNIYAQF